MDSVYPFARNEMPFERNPANLCAGSQINEAMDDLKASRGIRTVLSLEE